MPQRRAILGAFQGDRAEHLSADEVYPRAAESLPELSRGTVYATLAELSELGLLPSPPARRFTVEPVDTRAEGV
jgi:Fe2+ or Zn2+ uptake regulation protein